MMEGARSLMDNLGNLGQLLSSSPREMRLAPSTAAVTAGDARLVRTVTPNRRRACLSASDYIDLVLIFFSINSLT
jgi:hypothetical protein